MTREPNIIKQMRAAVAKGREPDIVDRLRAGLKLESLAVKISNPFLVDAASEAADEIEKLRATVNGIVEKGMDDLTMVAAFQVNERLREENDIMRRHLNLHPDKPLGNELRAEIERLTGEVKCLHETIGTIDRQHAAEIKRLRTALGEARQYVSDAGGDEDGETQKLSAALLADIDRALENKP